jgi:hypothetical protein
MLRIVERRTTISIMGLVRRYGLNPSRPCDSAHITTSVWIASRPSSVLHERCRRVWYSSNVGQPAP